MTKTMITFIFVLLLVFSSGCKADFLPPRREIDDLQIVQVVGIDKLQDSPNKVMLTAASQRVEGGGEQGGKDSSGEGGESKRGKALVTNSEGKTIFDAARNIQTHSDKTVFWGHSEYYLIGEEAARENISKHIDFFTRDHELRIDTKIYIVKGSTAREVIEAVSKTDFFISDKLDSLGRNIKLLGTSEEMKVSQLMKFIDIHHSSARVPCLELVKRGSDGEEQVSDIESDGYAIFKDLKLAGFIERDISRGVNLITDELGSSIVAVKDLSGQDISLEIIRSKTEVVPSFTGDNLEEILLKTRITSNLGEVQSQSEVFEEEAIHSMEKQQSEILKKEMEAVIGKAVEYSSDCLEICDKVRMKRPLKWHKIEKQWMEILPRIKFSVQVESKIERTYDLREPSGYKGKE